ncbi:MAG: zinc ribbon domain-containing protein [Acidobacteria bacterium]|nr:zinc ribbon domain-containing protein [Acidobacteriota bacterium]
MIYCPKCGADAVEGQNYCRKCGVNLALVSKAVNLGEVIARGDGGLLPKIRTFMGDMKLDAVSEQVGIHLEKINESLKSANRATGETSRDTSIVLPAWSNWAKWSSKPKSAADRQSKLLAEGFPSLFVGIAMMALLFVFGDMLVLRIPPDKAAKIPFDLAEAVHYLWMAGLIPALSGLGKLIAAGCIRPKAESAPAAPAPDAVPQIEAPYEAADFGLGAAPPSVTENTTARLDAHAPKRVRAQE